MRVLNLIESTVNRRRSGIKAFWWRPSSPWRRNFGDEITPIFIKKLWGIDCRWTRVADCELVGAGSILDLVDRYNPAGHAVKVWGSGLLRDGSRIDNRDLDVRLVRGGLTRGRLVSSEGVHLGDPGLLASRVYEKPRSNEGLIGVLPHIHDRKHPVVTRCQQLTSVLVIDPFDRPDVVARNINRCKVIFSSSLHGLIFSDSFSVPNRRLSFSKLEGGNYKFEDYYSSTDRLQPETLGEKDLVRILNNSDEVDRVMREYQPITNLTRIQEDIIDSFPYK